MSSGNTEKFTDYLVTVMDPEKLRVRDGLQRVSPPQIYAQEQEPATSNIPTVWLKLVGGYYQVWIAPGEGE